MYEKKILQWVEDWNHINCFFYYVNYISREKIYRWLIHPTTKFIHNKQETWYFHDINKTEMGRKHFPDIYNRPDSTCTTFFQMNLIWTMIYKPPYHCSTWIWTCIFKKKSKEKLELLKTIVGITWQLITIIIYWEYILIFSHTPQNLPN